jgi:glycosyltransferase involved in cell wall biosynthesis
VSSVSGLSLIVITRNEEQDIQDCLQSIKGIAQEIVIVDSGSTDRTLDICRRFTDHIFHNPWTGFSSQKQFALDKAHGPWILNIDADERVSAPLAQEIRLVLSAASPQSSMNGYEITFHNYFLGKRLRFGVGKREKHVRLFRKDNANYGTSRVHEGIQVRAPIGKLRHPIEHQSYKDLTEYLAKCNTYTSLMAQEKFDKGCRFHFWHHLRPPFEFFSRYILQLGFLDGEAGLIYALLSSYYVRLKFLKLRDLQRAKK